MRINEGRSSDIYMQRIIAYGKLWGVLNYFHPIMWKGRLCGDSLFLNHLGHLLTDQSDTNFRQSIEGLLQAVNDPKSILIHQEDKIPAIKAVARKTLENYLLPSGELYVSVSQTVFKKTVNIDSMLMKKRNKKIIIDLRCAEIDNELGLKQYKLFVQPLIASMVKSTMLLPTERTCFYKGLMREDFPQDINLFDPDEYGNVGHLQVHQGLRNISEGAYLPVAEPEKYSAYHYCFLINRLTNMNSVKAIMALRNRGQCMVVFDGPVPDYLFGSFYYQKLPDGLTAKVRTSEVIYEDGTQGRKPDFVFEGQSDTTLNALVIKQAVVLLKKGRIDPTCQSIENTVFIRKTAISNATIGNPDASQRLLGLFNFWNAINFFSPNKHLISVNWNVTLPYFVERFLAADTEAKYFMALMELTASTKDGHSILINTKTGRSPYGFLDGNLPFACEQIDDKVYVTSIMPDSMQQISLSGLHYGDEVIAIDGIPVDAIIRKWEPLLVASNTAGFKRELYATWFTAGAVGSEAKITVLHNSSQNTIVMNRINRNEYYSLWGKVIRPLAKPPVFPPNYKILTGDIGYIRLNRIFSSELDSVALLLRDCKKIIIDARGYPRDATIGTNISAYIATKSDTVAYDAFPFITSPDHKKTQILVDYSIIEPKPNLNLKEKQYYLLVDEGIQSQGEWNVIAIQGVTKTTTIGRATAGANGMAVKINLPGNYFTFFSGFGEYYMDHTPNQKNGVKVDIEVKRTLRAALSGEDDIMEGALKIISEK